MKLRNTFFARKRGIVLAEVIVSVAILAIAFIMMLGALIFGRISASMSKHRFEAINLLRQKAEELKDLNYDDVIAQTISNVVIDDGGTSTEDFNFSGALDLNGSGTGGTGEDINSNGILDTETSDDLLGTMAVVITDVIDLNSDSVYDYDDAKVITVTLSWQEKYFGVYRNISESLSMIISKYYSR